LEYVSQQPQNVFQIFMPLHSFLLLVKRADDLIRTKSTGTPRQMAQRRGLSERAWYYLLDQLREDYGLPIAYCRFRCSYYYTDDASHWEDFLQKFINYTLYNKNEKGGGNLLIISILKIKQNRHGKATNKNTPLQEYCSGNR